jgi:chitin synthase
MTLSSHHCTSYGCPPCRIKKHAGLDCYPPLQIMYATKTTNRGKLDSHCWFFDGFAYLLQPDYCVLFDAGKYLN